MQKIKIPVKPQKKGAEEKVYLEKITSLALNFKVQLCPFNDDQYQCCPVDTNNIFGLWYLDQNITKKSAEEACFYLISQYTQFIGFGKAKSDKLSEAQPQYVRRDMLPDLNILPLNSKFLEEFQRAYQQKRSEEAIEKNKSEYIVGDEIFADELIQMGYLRSDANNPFFFRIPDSPAMEVEFINTKIRVGFSLPKFLEKVDLTTLKCFGKLAAEDRQFFQANFAPSLETMRKYLNDQITIWSQLRQVNDLSAWAVERYERSKRITELTLSIMSEKRS